MTRLMRLACLVSRFVGRLLGAARAAYEQGRSDGRVDYRYSQIKE